MNAQTRRQTQEQAQKKTQPLVKAPTEIKAYFERLIKTSEQLIKLLNMENEMIRNREVERLTALQDEKNRLARSYEQLMRTLKQQPELISGANEAQYEQLTQLAQSFREAATENLRVLKAEHEVGSKVLSAIRQAVTKEMNDVPVYSSGPQRSPRAARRQQQPVSISIDQSL